MKTRHTLQLDTTYPSIVNNSSIDQYQDGSDINQEIKRSKKISKKIKHDKQEKKLIHQLQELIILFPELPSLLSGPLRRLKVEPHYREPTSRLLRSRQEYRETSKIRLTGNWIEKAGFITHERIRVIPMDRMLIIIPEETSKRKIKRSKNLNSR